MGLLRRRSQEHFFIAKFGNWSALEQALERLKALEGMKAEVLDSWTIRVSQQIGGKDELEAAKRLVRESRGYVEPKAE